MQKIADDWFLKASPLERQQTLDTHQGQARSSERQHHAKAAGASGSIESSLIGHRGQLETAGALVCSPMNSPKRNSGEQIAKHGMLERLRLESELRLDVPKRELSADIPGPLRLLFEKFCGGQTAAGSRQNRGRLRLLSSAKTLMAAMLGAASRC